MNGKLYDVKTGAVVGDSPAVAPARNIDGFAKNKSTHVNLAPPRIKPVAVSIVSKPVMDMAPRKSRKPAQHAVKTVQPSKTLMRHAVTKPDAPLKRTVKAHSHTAALAGKPKVISKQMVQAIDERRVQVAGRVQKSTRISKFSRTGVYTNAPVAVAVRRGTPAPAAAPIKPAPQKTDIFTQALEQATSHEQTYEAPRKRGRSLSVALVAVLVAGGLIAGGMQGTKALKVHMASTKAGFSIASPNYTPAGFSMDGLNSEAGSASLNYKSNSDDRAFSITQKASAWDSSSLKNSVLDATGKKYQTVEAAGRTIYIDDQANANWVNGGIWYQVSNENALNNKQIVEIAQSL